MGGLGFAEQLRLARLLYQFFGPQQGRQMTGNAIQPGGPLVRCPFFLACFYPLPLRPYCLYRLRLRFTENMGVAADQFFDDISTDFFKIERAPLAGQLAVEYYLEKQVAQLLDHLMVISRLDSVHQFIDFFHRVETQAQVVLFAVPGTARG